MSKLTIPKNYSSALNLHDTQLAIKTVKDFFQGMLAQRLSLTRVSAPLFVDPTTGLNDNLNGYERPVTFGILEQGDKEAEVVHSLAKWKRYALKKYGFSLGEGIYTDMNAIRRDEETDNIHSIFVDQWDWEKVIRKEDRNLDFLEETVKTVYKCLRKTEQYMAIQYDYIDLILPKDITFITTSELEEMFPDNTPKEREYYFAKAKGAICVMQIGDKLANGEPHDGRAPDYDDWALNADIIVYYPVLDIALELSSMGIRVDEKSLKEQLDKAGCPERAKLPFQKAILNKELPYTIGGGIGQSRICMFFLRKAHIGEVQSSLWPEETIKECEEHGIQFLYSAYHTLLFVIKNLLCQTSMTQQVYYFLFFSFSICITKISINACAAIIYTNILHAALICELSLSNCQWVLLFMILFGSFIVKPSSS